MNREDIIRMAREAGIRLASQSDTVDPRNVYSHEIERYAHLVVAHEREECAETVEKLLNETINCLAIESAEHKLVKNITSQFKEGITAAIRARGEK
jgi:hypothetical protein